MIHVMLADRNEIFLAGMQTLFATDTRFVVSTAPSLEALLECLERNVVDVLLCEATWIQALGAHLTCIQHNKPGLRVLCLVDATDSGALLCASLPRLSGLVMKYPTSQTLTEAILAAYAGQEYVRLHSVDFIKQWAMEIAHEKNKLKEKHHRFMLMRRQGYSYPEIAERLHMNIQSLYNLKSKINKLYGCSMASDLTY